MKNLCFVPILEGVNVLDYVIAAVFLAHVLYFAGCLLVMGGIAIAAPFVWLWQCLRPKQVR